MGTRSSSFITRHWEMSLLRSWEARNGKRGGELIWLDMLMVDVNATVMQAMISVNRLIRFRHKLTAGKMSSVTGFDFARDPSTSSSSTKGVELVQSSKKENFPEKYSIKSKKQTQYESHSKPSWHPTFLIFVP
ncbi:hypothetical protein Bca52824_023612 [Brassica carinata]|uniref:Uncharacterized protein n=1 Tax=Brassica carinata TaxID=52824 RepID=A0A8X8ATA4_BRACI|nr:hypothetical protein Bca52824_023612 [Brassica carinata]